AEAVGRKLTSSGPNGSSDQRYDHLGPRHQRGRPHRNGGHRLLWVPVPDQRSEHVFLHIRCDHQPSRGELKARFVSLYDNPTGVATAQRRIDAAASTGRFAGLLAFLFASGTTTSSSPFTVGLDLSGKICYARG